MSGKAEQAAIHLIFSRWMILLLAIAIVAPWLVIASLLASQNAASGNSKAAKAVETAGQAEASALAVGPPPQEWTMGKKGPWGQIDSMLFAIDVPDEFVFVPAADQPPVRWSFPGSSQEQVLAVLR